MERMTQSEIPLTAVTKLLATPLRSGMDAEQEKLAARIERLIRRETNDKVRELRVLIQDNGITLRGRCGTFYCKQLAQHAAMKVSEDEPLVNEIDVW